MPPKIESSSLPAYVKQVIPEELVDDVKVVTLRSSDGDPKLNFFVVDKKNQFYIIADRENGRISEQFFAEKRSLSDKPDAFVWSIKASGYNDHHSTRLGAEGLSAVYVNLGIGPNDISIKGPIKRLPAIGSSPSLYTPLTDLGDGWFTKRLQPIILGENADKLRVANTSDEANAYLVYATTYEGVDAMILSIPKSDQPDLYVLEGVAAPNKWNEWSYLKQTSRTPFEKIVPQFSRSDFIDKSQYKKEAGKLLGQKKDNKVRSKRMRRRTGTKAQDFRKAYGEVRIPLRVDETSKALRLALERRDYHLQKDVMRLWDRRSSFTAPMLDS